MLNTFSKLFSSVYKRFKLCSLSGLAINHAYFQTNNFLNLQSMSN